METGRDCLPKLEGYLRPFTVLGHLLGLSIRFDLDERVTQPRRPTTPKRTLHRILILILGSASFLQVFNVVYMLSSRQTGHVEQFLLPTAFCSSYLIYVYMLRRDGQVSGVLSSLVRKTAKHLHACPPVVAQRHLLTIKKWTLVHASVAPVFALSAASLLLSMCVFRFHYTSSDVRCSEEVSPILRFVLVHFGCLGFIFADAAVDILNCAIFLPITVLLASSLMNLVFLLLSVNFDVLRHIAAMKDTEVGSKTKLLLKMHRDVCDSVCSVDQRCSFLIFVWFAVLILDSICLFRVLMLPKSFIFSLAVFFLFTLGAFLKDSLAICRINAEVTNSLCIICPEEFRPVDEFGSLVFMETPRREKLDYQMYCSRFQINQPRITGWGFYNINKEFLLSVAATALTYTLILQNVN